MPNRKVEPVYEFKMAVAKVNHPMRMNTFRHSCGSQWGVNVPVPMGYDVGKFCVAVNGGLVRIGLVRIGVFRIEVVRIGVVPHGLKYWPGDTTMDELKLTRPIPVVEAVLVSKMHCCIRA
jgi:hypothetical protein